MHAFMPTFASRSLKLKTSVPVSDPSLSLRTENGIYHWGEGEIEKKQWMDASDDRMDA